MKTVNSDLLGKFTQITHVFTTRKGGVSKSPYLSNNLAFHVEDHKDDVLTNHQNMSQHLDYDYKKLVHMRQIHSDKIVIVKPTIHNFKNPPECDALITNQPNIPLMVMTADCSPVLFYDPKQKVIAVAHAGRAGALKGIIPKTVNKMQEVFGSELIDIQVVLGPSIGACCYEIGEKIATEVLDAGYNSAVIQKDCSFHLDVNTIIHRQLQEIGIHEEKIEDINICNACENNRFFSYRADYQKTGRMSGIIMLKK